jgi:hypothetical protein
MWCLYAVYVRVWCCVCVCCVDLCVLGMYDNACECIANRICVGYTCVCYLYSVQCLCISVCALDGIVNGVCEWCVWRVCVCVHVCIGSLCTCVYMSPCDQCEAHVVCEAQAYIWHCSVVRNLYWARVAWSPHLPQLTGLHGTCPGALRTKGPLTPAPWPLGLPSHPCFPQCQLRSGLSSSPCGMNTSNAHSSTWPPMEATASSGSDSLPCKAVWSVSVSLPGP